MRSLDWVGRDEIYRLGCEGLWIGLGGMTAMEWVVRDQSYGLAWDG